MNVKIYDRLYDVVSENMNNAGEQFTYEKQTLLLDIGNHPQEIDVTKYLELPNDKFFQAVFVAMFKRLPEEREILGWKPAIEKDKETFQKEFLLALSKSSVAAINHMKLINNPYFEPKYGMKYKMLGKLYGLTDKSSLRELGKKLPWPIQKIIRKVFL